MKGELECWNVDIEVSILSSSLASLDTNYTMYLYSPIVTGSTY